MANNPYGAVGPFAPATLATDSSGLPATLATGSLLTPATTAAVATSRAWITTIASVAFVGALVAGVATVATTVLMRQIRPMPVQLLVAALGCLFVTATLALVGLRLAEYARALGVVASGAGALGLEAAAQRARTLWVTAGVFAMGWLVVLLVGALLVVRATNHAPTITAVDAVEAH